MKKKFDLRYFLHFYWFYLIGGIALLAAVIGISVSLLTKEPEPDYTVALMTASAPEESVLLSLEKHLESAGEDLNRDGRVWVDITPFSYAAVQRREDTDNQDPYKAVADTVWFQAEILTGKSCIYILTPYTYDTLLALDESFFVPVSDCIAGTAGMTIPMSAVSDDDFWQDYEIALHIPENSSAAESSFTLLEKLLEDKS